jgi:hypothetical protein
MTDQRGPAVACTARSAMEGIGVASQHLALYSFSDTQILIFSATSAILSIQRSHQLSNVETRPQSFHANPSHSPQSFSPQSFFMRLCSGSSCGLFICSFRRTSNVPPVLHPDVIINLNRYICGVQLVSSPAFASRDPVILARRPVVVVGLEPTANDATEDLIVVEDRTPGPIECHPPDPRPTCQTACLALNIHNPRSSAGTALGGFRLGRLLVCCNHGRERCCFSGWSLRHEAFSVARQAE